MNELEAMPSKILLATVGLTSDSYIVDYRAAVAENIRASTYFIQVFADDWGPKNLFRKMFHLAVECRNDPALPMREIAVFLKAAPLETDPEILVFRRELEERQDVRIFGFDKVEGLREQLAATCRYWVRAILAASATSAG